MPVLRKNVRLQRSKSADFQTECDPQPDAYRHGLGIESSDSESDEDADVADLRSATIGAFRSAAGQENRVQLDDYFGQNARILSSDDETADGQHAPLKVPLSALREHLDAADDRLPKSVQQLTQKYEAQFDKWMLYLSENFNVLLYGYGSKLSLLETFRRQQLVDRYNHVVLHGYQPTASVKQLLTMLIDNLHLNVSVSPTNPKDCSYAVCEVLSQLKDPLDIVLLVHNIDGIALRNPLAQTVLSVLADSPSVHVIASVDHVNAAALWDQTKLTKFNWLWMHVTTFRSYRAEILASDVKALGLSCAKRGGSHSVASLRSIWKSLTPNAKSAFLQLVSLVLADETSSAPSGITFWTWYRSCLEDFVVSSELALRQHLREFTDHNMISKKTGMDGAENLALNVGKDLLTEFFMEEGINLDIPGLMQT